MRRSCRLRQAAEGQLSIFDTVTDRLEATVSTCKYLLKPNRATEISPLPFRVCYSGESARLWEGPVFSERRSTLGLGI
jgi:hypothetical protein